MAMFSNNPRFLVLHHLPLVHLLVVAYHVRYQVLSSLERILPSPLLPSPFTFSSTRAPIPCLFPLASYFKFLSSTQSATDSFPGT